jgi:hypothetical protein
VDANAFRPGVQARQSSEQCRPVGNAQLHLDLLRRGGARRGVPPSGSFA